MTLDKKTGIAIIQAIMNALRISIHEIYENPKTKLLEIEK